MSRIKRVCAALLGLMLFSAFAQAARVPLELAERLAGPQTLIYVGTLPPKTRLAFRLPVPPETRVVGSTALAEVDETYDLVTLFLNSTAAGFDFQAYYRKVFRELGWQQGQTFDQTGFLPSNMQGPDGSLSFCHTVGGKETNVYLSLTHRSRTTLIDAQISTVGSGDTWSACETDEDYIVPPLPSLVAPEGSKTQAPDMLTGAPTFGNGASLIVVETALSAEALLRYYSEQLELSGWQALGGAVNQEVQIKTYRFREKAGIYGGTLQITPLGQRGRYLAQLVVAKL